MHPTALAAAVGDAHERIDADGWDDVYVVGDVHGCLRELRTLLDRLDPSPTDLVVFVGDLVRKGPSSAAVVDLVRRTPNFETVRGNNEEKLLRGEASVGLSEGALEWVASRPVVLHWDDAAVVHAGIDPRKPLAAHTVDDFETVRELGDASYEPPFWYDAYEGPERVFFGHTPLSRSVVRDHAVGLDTGCVYGGELTAYDYDRERFVTVESDRTVQERPAHEFVTPRHPVVR